MMDEGSGKHLPAMSCTTDLQSVVTRLVIDGLQVRRTGFAHSFPSSAWERTFGKLLLPVRVAPKSSEVGRNRP